MPPKKDQNSVDSCPSLTCSTVRPAGISVVEVEDEDVKKVKKERKKERKNER